MRHFNKYMNVYEKMYLEGNLSERFPLLLLFYHPRGDEFCRLLIGCRCECRSSKPRSRSVLRRRRRLLRTGFCLLVACTDGAAAAA